MKREVVVVDYDTGRRSYNTLTLDSWLNKGYNIISVATPHVSSSTANSFSTIQLFGSIIYVLEKPGE